MTPAIRIAGPSDLNLIRSSWHRSFWSVKARKHGIDPAVYDQGQRERINRLIPRSVVLVAFFPEVPDEILGWTCMEGDALHYAFVKAPYRRRGIATGLVAGRASCYTHATDRVGEAFAASINAVLNPYRLET